MQVRAEVSRTYRGSSSGNVKNIRGGGKQAVNGGSHHQAAAGASTHTRGQSVALCVPAALLVA